MINTANRIAEALEMALYRPLQQRQSELEEIARLWQERRYGDLVDALSGILELGYGVKVLLLSFLKHNISQECADFCKRELGVTTA